MTGSDTAKDASGTHRTERVMLHGPEPVELEIWDEEEQEATHVVSEYMDSAESIDITALLRRAGYELREVHNE